MPTVLLVRHGRTTANAAGLLAGWGPGIDLDDIGRAQASGLGERIGAAGIAVCRAVSSPLPRCLETAALVLAQAGPGLPVEQDERLAECRYGAWTGRRLSELASEPLWRTVQDQPAAATFPDGADYPGESLAAMSARAVEAVREIDAATEAREGAGAAWIAITHGDVVKALLADAMGLHLDQFQRLTVDPGSVSVVRYGLRRPAVLRVNDVGGDLRGLAVAPSAAGDADVGGGAGAASAAS
ncbi:MAG: MSMEG_4193 family putative phosphomutase [Dermatophilaceae bacterium]